MEPPRKILGLHPRYWNLALIPAGIYWLLMYGLMALRAPERSPSLASLTIGSLAFGVIFAAMFYLIERKSLQRWRALGIDVNEADLLKPTQERTLALTGDRASVFRRVEQAIIEFGALIETRSEAEGTIRAYTAQSWKSYGEQIDVLVADVGAEAGTAAAASASTSETRVTIRSRPRMWIINRFTNYGQSWENVESLAVYLQSGRWPDESASSSEIIPALRNPPPQIFQLGAWQRLLTILSCYAITMPAAVRDDKLAMSLVLAVIGVGIEIAAYRKFVGNVRRKVRTELQEHAEAILINVWVVLFLAAMIINPNKALLDLDNVAGGFLILAFAGLIYKRVQDRAAELAQRAASKRERERTDLERQLAEARLVALSAQIEPHFLFNTLASIQYLIRHDALKAESMVSDLIRYLRLALPKMKQATAPLEDELNLVRAYLGIMQIRMGERLNYRVEATNAPLSLQVPTMTLITLVENAIKHGLERKPEGGRIDVSAHIEDADLLLRVADTGGGFSTENSGTGVGLANIRERLVTLYASRGASSASLSLAPNTPTGVVAAVQIPLLLITEASQQQPSLSAHNK